MLVSAQPPVALAMNQAATPDPITPAPATGACASSLTPQELQSRADAFVKLEKFNRSFTLAATEAHSELTVTYAVAGLDSVEAPTILFIGGMFGGRYLAAIADHVGSNLGMRVVVIDRPGIGGSTPVDPSIRLSVWLETVPAVMRILNAQHLSLVAHSCGVIYALNTVYAMPWILPPSNRKLYLFSPWVSPDHSGVGILSLSSHLPSTLINSFDNIVRFVNKRVLPTVQFTGMVSGVISAPFSSAPRDGATNNNTRIEKDEQDELCFEYLGISASENKARTKAIVHSVFSESTSGASHEALLSLKKEVAESWGVCDDYESYPTLLEARLKEFFQQNKRDDTGLVRGSSAMAGSIDGTPAQNRVGIKTFWAETDIMIGKQGEEYFDKCFRRQSAVGNPDGTEDDKCLLYESEIVPETTHETLCLPQYGALSRVFEDMIRLMA